MSPKPVVCPFCSLHCDDLVIDSEGALVDSRCGLADRQFQAATNPPPVRIGSQICESMDWGSIDWGSIREALQLPDVPTVEFCDASIGESKSLETLVADRTIRIRYRDDQASLAIDQTIARDGMMAATLGDVLRHAEFIWVVGDIETLTPRLNERLRRSNARIESSPLLSIELLSQLHQSLGDLTAVGDQPRVAIDSTRVAIDSTRVAIDSPRTGGDIFQQVLDSRYTAIVVGRSPFESGCEVVASEMLIRWIQKWNDLAIPVAGEDDVEDEDHSPISRVVMMRFTQHQNLRSVTRWRNNQISPSLYSHPSVTSIRVGDAGTTNEETVRLQIGGPDAGPSNAHVYIPAAIPGVHHSDASIRGDGSVTLPLLECGRSDHPRRIDVLRRILDVF